MGEAIAVMYDEDCSWLYHAAGLRHGLGGRGADGTTEGWRYSAGLCRRPGMTSAGHTYVFGRCDCFRHRADVNGAAREAIAQGTTLIDQDGIAHFGKCSAHEWAQILEDVETDAKAYELGMTGVRSLG